MLVGNLQQINVDRFSKTLRLLGREVDLAEDGLHTSQEPDMPGFGVAIGDHSNSKLGKHQPHHGQSVKHESPCLFTGASLLFT